MPCSMAMSTDVQVMRSELDASVNWIAQSPHSSEGKIEARYVRRRDDYFIIYVSSAEGCARNCRMCFLTQTGQRSETPLTLEQIIAQADQGLAHYDEQTALGLTPPAKVVHFNFMARGEVLCNPFIREAADDLLWPLTERARARGLQPSFKLSTIMPSEMRELELTDLFGGIPVDFYYSFYSTDDAFRRRWLPDAIPWQEALGKLVRYQAVARKIPVIHWAYIEGENDSAEEAERIADAVSAAGLRVDVNIVRYNPFSDKQGQEPPIEVIERNARILGGALPGARIKIVDRVGFDVNASCGMFVGERRRKTS